MPWPDLDSEDGDGGFAARVQGRLDRLGLTPAEVAKPAGWPPGLLDRVLRGTAPAPRGKRLVGLADALATSVSYLVGLDPDTPVPEEFLQEDQATLGLLAGDEDALLRAYRRLDVPARAALLLLVTRLSPEPILPERPARQVRPGPLKPG